MDLKLSDCKKAKPTHLRFRRKADALKWLAGDRTVRCEIPGTPQWHKARYEAYWIWT